MSRLLSLVITFSGVARKFFPGEQIQRVFPSSPFLSPILPLSPSPFPPLPHPRSRTPKIQLRDLGERCELPQRGLGRSAEASAEIEFGAL